MPRSKVGEPKLQARVVEIVRDAGMPVSVDYVGYNAGVSWTTARAILFELILQGRVLAQKTSKSWIFHTRTSSRDAESL